MIPNDERNGNLPTPRQVATELYSIAAAFIISSIPINEEKLLREFQRLLVLLWPNNKQIRRMAKVIGKK